MAHLGLMLDRISFARYAESMGNDKKRPRDTNQRAKLITDIASGEVEDSNPDKGKNLHAVALGRKGGLKGGKARAKSLTSQQRKDIAKKAAQARWKKD